MDKRIKKIDLSELEFVNEDVEFLDELIDKVYICFRKTGINSENKNVFYLRNEIGVGLIGIQVGDTEDISNYLIYKYFASPYEKGVFLRIVTHTSDNLYKDANSINKIIGDDLIGCCRSLEEKYFKEDPGFECKISKNIKRKKKTNVLQRLFTKK
jgi:hypothetical protein